MIERVDSYRSWKLSPRQRHEAALEAERRRLGYEQRPGINNPWHQRNQLAGTWGEIVYGLETGQPVHWDQPKPTWGDGGYDFPDGVNAKGAPRWRSPRLMVHQVETRTWPPVGFALVALDFDRGLGRLIGCATVDMVRGAPVLEHGYGPTYTLRIEQLITRAVLLPLVPFEAGCG